MSVTESERKSYPVYIMLDVSASMRRRNGNARTPQQAFMTFIPDLILSLSDSTAMATAVWISVIAFSDDAQLLSPMTSLIDPAHVREPDDGTETDYVKALAFLERQFTSDSYSMQQRGRQAAIHTTVAQPLVFVITDGAPYANRRRQRTDEWLPFRDRLVAPPTEARIAAIGLGGAHPPTLYRLATGQRNGDRNSFLAEPGVSGDALARSVINVIERSIKLSVRVGEMIIDPPVGMRRVHV